MFDLKCVCVFLLKEPKHDDIPVATRRLWPLSFSISFKEIGAFGELAGSRPGSREVQGENRNLIVPERKIVSKANEIIKRSNATNLIAFPLGKFGTL